MLLGLATRHGNDCAAQPLGAIVSAKATSEQTVAVTDMNLILRSPAGGVDRPGHHQGPQVDVRLAVADHGGFASGAAGSVHPDYLLHRHGKHAEGILISQIFLGGYRQPSQVFERFNVVRVYSCLFEFVPVKGDMLIGVVQGIA